MSRGGPALGLALVALAGVCGCGRAGGELDLVLADVSVCAPGWQVIQHVGIQSGAPSTLALSGSDLYYPLWDGKQIVAVPESGGAPRVVAAQAAYKVWIEGDMLTYAILDDKLWRVPMAGGEPVLIEDGQTTFAPPSYSMVADVSLDDTTFYWDLRPQVGDQEWSVWRSPRDGGAAQQIATLPFPTPAYSWRTLTAVPGGLLVTVESDVPAAYFLPRDGGSPRTLAPPPAPAPGGVTKLVGTGPAGVLWVNETWNSGEPWATTSMTLVDARAPAPIAARPFWSDKPAAVRPEGYVIDGWPDDSGSWIIAGTELFSDRLAHVTIWQVGADGSAARRIGCNPTGASGFASAVALSPDAVYVVTGVENDSSSYFDYSIVKLAR